jgi:hypothetical protein
VNEIPEWLFEVPVGTLIPCDKAPLFPVTRPEIMVGKRVVVLLYVQLSGGDYWQVEEQKVRP